MRRLDERETELLTLVSNGASTLEAAEALKVSDRTVKTWINQLTTEFGAANRVELIAKALRSKAIR